MDFYLDINNASFFIVEDEGLIKAAAVIPCERPAKFLYADSGVSLTHLIKEASEFFLEGKVLVDKNTVVVDFESLEKLAAFWNPLGAAGKIKSAFGSVGSSVSNFAKGVGGKINRSVEGVNNLLKQQMARASNTEFGRQTIKNVSDFGYQYSANPQFISPVGIATGIAGAIGKAALPKIEPAAMKGLENLGGWGARVAKESRTGMPFIKGFSANPRLEYLRGLDKLAEKFELVDRYEAFQAPWVMEKVSSLLMKTGGSYIIKPSPMEKVAGKLESDELELWKKYKNTGDKHALSQLMLSMKPLVKSRVAPWTKNSPLPTSAVEAEGMKLLRHAIDTYDPIKGAQLKTHAWHGLNKIHRYGYTYQNVGSIPEPRAAKVGSYQNAEEMLKDKFGREPTVEELNDELGWGISDIKAMREELRRDLSLDETLGPVSFNKSDIGTEALHLVYHDANPIQKLVMEYTFDEFEGKPTIGGNAKEIAKQLKISPAEVRKNYKWIAGELDKVISSGSDNPFSI